MTEKKATNGRKPEVLLDLDELTEPLFVFRISGKRYTFRRWGALSLLEQNRSRALYARMAELEELGDATTDDNATEYAAGLVELIGILSDMDAEAAAASDNEMIGRAVIAFFGQRAASQQEGITAILTALTPKTTATSITETSSPASTVPFPKRTRKSG